MIPRSKKLLARTKRLVARVEHQRRCNFADKVPGWQHLNMNLQRAIMSANRAVEDNVNYPRLVLAFDELCQVAS